MSDPASIMTRIRAVGANVEIDRGKLRIINGRRVPDQLRAELRQHGKAVAGWLEREGDFAERAATIEYDGGVPRAQAEDLARILLASPPNGCEPADWTWFVTEASKIIDARAA